MIQTLPCPDAARWEAMLADANPADSPELESHLSGCTRCRTMLDEIAVGESGWLRDAGRLATSTSNDPEMTKTLHRLRDYWPDDTHGPPIPLDFLTPTDQPGLLGTLGRYQVLEVIGRGAMGIVLKAIDPDLLRPVAVKVLAPYLAPSGTARQRFLREARAAAAVSHDHIVTIHAVESADLPYLVMEFVSGISLQARIDRDGPLPPKDIARIGHQAACGLAAAHAVGLVHRDVKPANILLENGVERVKITDFGLARAADDARLTQSGTTAGTPLFMSPEQARGETVDHRSDLFSLGAVLYTLATGFPPFRAGSTMGVLNRIANDPPRPIRETVPDFPAALEKIIMQLLEKDSAKRIQMAADVSVKLTAYLSDPQPEPLRRRSSRKTWLAGSLPIVAGIVVLGTVLVFNTPKGTIIVEVDDPGVQVAIDGEELTITGTGVQQVKVKPGTYHIKATKDGKPAHVSQEVVTITKDGKQVVKVTVKPDVVAGKDPEVLEFNVNPVLEKRLAVHFPAGPHAQLDVLRLAWREARWPKHMARKASDPTVPQTHPKYPELQKLVTEAGKEDTTTDRVKEVLAQAYTLAETILKDTATSAAMNRRKDETKIDPWDAVLKPLADQAQSLGARLAGTKGNRFITLPGPVTDLDKATADLAEPDRATVKRLLALRDQFGLAFPKAQQMAVKVAQAREQPGAGNQVEKLENDLRVQHEALATVLIEMEKLATSLGARPVSDTAWDVRLRKLVDECLAVIDRLAKTTPGRILLTANPGADPDKATAALTKEEAFTAKRLLALRDQFGLLVPQFQKDIGRWEQANLAAKDANQKFAAGVISANVHEAAQLSLKDADRALTAAESAMVKIVADLQRLSDELKTTSEGPTKPAESPEAEFKKTVAEYDALTLRLVNTQTGRVLALAQGESISETDLTEGGVPPSAQGTARRLLALRAKILNQKLEAEIHVRALNQSGSPQELATALQGLKFRYGAFRGLVNDLKTLADEIDPAPDAELKKVMAEYDALVLKLADNPIGRVLALIPPEKGWNPDEVQRTLATDAQTADRAVQMLVTRGHIRNHAELAEKATTARASALRRKSESTKAGPDENAQLDDVIRKQENEIKLRTVALRGLVADLKKVADGYSPKGKRTDK